jgi:hypothetical protein
MTADFYSFNMAFLGATATRSINEVNAGRGRRSRVPDAPTLASSLAEGAAAQCVGYPLM